MTITRKLILMNGLICIAFIIVILIVFFSFRNVEKVLTTLFVRETHRIIKNSEMTREVSRVLSDLNLILSTFYKNDDVLETGGKRLLNDIQMLMMRSGDNGLKASLNRLTQQITDILAQCREVNRVHYGIADIEKQVDEQLISLDNVVAERLVELIVKGEDTSVTEQLSSLIGGYHESFLRVQMKFDNLGLEHFKRSVVDQAHPLYAMLDDIHLRFRTLTASVPEIAVHGRELIRLIRNYKKIIPVFHHTAGNLRIQLDQMNAERETLLLGMEKTDRQVVIKTGEARLALIARIHDTMAINLFIFIGILPVVIFAGLMANSIKKPVKKVIETIERLARGEAPEPIDERYKGEFNHVRNNMNILIDATNKVTRVAEQVAFGNIDIIVRERSGDDRLMQALNSMIQSLKKFRDETDSMIRAVGAGQLEVRGNAGEFHGGWRELVTGVNDLVGGLREAVSTSAALNHEMALARQIQTALLPKSLEHIHPELKIVARMDPADQVGGDFYDVSFDNSGNLWVAIGDVSGHGVTPGLIMMMAQTVYTSAINEPGADARRVVAKTNEILYKNVHERLGESHFMTFLALKYRGGGCFQYAGAHLSMMIHRHKTGECDLVATQGVYLNLKKDIYAATRNANFCLEPGDSLVLYSDGITEARNPDEKILDLDGFEKIVKKYIGNDPEQCLQMIFADVSLWCRQHRSDDMTLVIIKRKELLI